MNDDARRPPSGPDYQAIAEDAASATLPHMFQAVRHIDAVFGKDYARKHPELVGAFMQAAMAWAVAGAINETTSNAADNIAMNK